jgi:uncharacterized protein DUF6602
LGVINSVFTMILPEYLSDVARDMRAKSAAIRRDFASHRLSAGENREDLVSEFLVNHLPRKFGVSSGMVISHDGLFSNQADLVVVDEQNNAPLYAAARNKLWPVEAVYALIEVKTTLHPADLEDAIAKGRKFKALKRRFCEAGQVQRIADSLFVIWAFDSAATATVKANLVVALAGIPRSEQPDLIVVPDRFVARAGSYLEIARLGQANSPHRAQLHAQHGSNLEPLFPEPAEVGELGENALMAWYVWFDSWLRQAGSRLTDPLAYLPPDQTYGRVV